MRLLSDIGGFSDGEDMELPLVSVSRNEWEAFLADHSRLMQKYELLLSRIDLLQTRIEGMRERTAQQIEKSRETLRQTRVVLDRLSDETERQLLESD